MPLYEYECQACGHHLEAQQRMADAALLTCPSCGKDELQKLISATAFHLKGGGWYKDLYASAKPGASSDSGGSSPPPTGAKPDAGASGTKGSESSASSDSSAKPDSASKSSESSSAPAASKPAAPAAPAKGGSGS